MKLTKAEGRKPTCAPSITDVFVRAVPDFAGPGTAFLFF